MRLLMSLLVFVSLVNHVYGGENLPFEGVYSFKLSNGVVLVWDEYFTMYGDFYAGTEANLMHFVEGDIWEYSSAFSIFDFPFVEGVSPIRHSAWAAHNFSIVSVYNEDGSTWIDPTTNYPWGYSSLDIFGVSSLPSLIEEHLLVIIISAVGLFLALIFVFAAIQYVCGSLGSESAFFASTPKSKKSSNPSARARFSSSRYKGRRKWKPS